MIKSITITGLLMFKPQRNVKILEAYQAEISQHKIAAFLQRSQPTVNAIIKREKAKGE